MSRRCRRTSAPTPMQSPPMEIPPPVDQSSATPTPPASIPSMFGPGVWCPPRPLPSMPPSSALCWPTGVQQPTMASLAHQSGMASSVAQGPLWAPAGVGVSSYPWSVPNNLEESDVQQWGLDSNPPGDFLNILKSTPQAVSNGSSSQAIHIDDDNNNNYSRTEKRLTWTKPEDLRLVSAWLNNSNDPIQSNFKKNDQYWKGVADVFNSTTQKNRVRTAKQLKDHFGRMKKRVAWFCGNWKEANAMWASGESDEDVMNKALRSYEEDHKKDGPFMFRHCWEVLSKEPKWEAYLERLEDLEPDKREFNVEDDVEQHFCLDDTRDERPIGGKKAKEQMKKRKKEQPCVIDLENELSNFLDAQKTANEGRKELLETQRRVSSENLEARKLAHLAAKEHKESVMLETYRALLMNENPAASFALPPEVKTSRNPRFADVMRRKAAIRAQPQHTQLKNDLIEHIWHKFGNRYHN